MQHNHAAGPMGSVIHPESVGTLGDAIRLFCDKSVVVHIAHPDSEVYVNTTKESICIRAFPALYPADDNTDWQRMSIDPLTLRDVLQQQPVQFMTDARSLFSEETNAE